MSPAAARPTTSSTSGSGTGGAQTAPNSSESKRLGRPPDADSSDTRRRILDIGRSAFARGGYDAATNRQLADEVGITAGALYHYFGSKLDLYVAVHDDIQERIYARFNEAIGADAGFLANFEAVLDAAHVMNREDPTLAAFVGVVRSDMRRRPEIEALLRSEAERRDDFFVRLVDGGVATGEIDRTNRPFVVEFVRIVLIGLTDGVSHDYTRHKRAVTSIKRVLRGDLLSTDGS